jgi:hypothetical protein
MSRSTFVFRQFALGLTSIARWALGPLTPWAPTSSSRGEVTADGKVLRYTAHAGHIGIRDNEAGDVHGNMFFVAYTLDRAPGTRPRPLTFVWNGGPGSNSGLVHLLGFGPKRITAATGSMPRFSPWGTALVDNQDTWLAHSDLRLRRSGRHGIQPSDQAGICVRVLSRPWRRGSRWRSSFGCIVCGSTRSTPLFIAGESYGVTARVTRCGRSSAVARV